MRNIFGFILTYQSFAFRLRIFFVSFLGDGIFPGQGKFKLILGVVPEVSSKQIFEIIISPSLSKKFF